ncbi:hypothetical protein Tco_1172824 [Tanacetum coccineum]
MVSENMARHKAWVDVVLKLKFRLSKWKAKTLSIGGRLTLLKSVLGASPLYNMSIFKAPKGVLKEMESIRNNFFIGADLSNKKITWVAWNKVLASKKKGGIGVSSFYALNRTLLLKWVWRFVSQDGSLWFQVIQAIYGSTIDSHSVQMASNWCDSTLRDDFPRMYVLELDKQISVADKMAAQRMPFPWGRVKVIENHDDLFLPFGALRLQMVKVVGFRLAVLDFFFKLEYVVLVCQAHIQHQEPFGRRLQYCLVVHLGFSESSPFR